MRVLIIDVTADRIRWLQNSLEAMGHDVRTASDPKSALDQFRETCFDVAFFDHDLGVEPNGSRLATMVLESRKCKKPKAVWIHTSNTVGAQNIASKFHSANIPYVIQPYNDVIRSPDFRANVTKLLALVAS